MPDNSFEHNMRRQMGDFSFPASDAVWQKLEVNLQKRKKRRWAIIWFFSGLVLVGAGFYFMSKPVEFNKETIKESRPVSNNLQADITENQSVKSKNNETVKSLIPESKSLSKETSAKQFILKKDNELARQEIRIIATEKMFVDSNDDKGVEAEKNEEAPMVLTAAPIMEKVSEAQNVDTQVAVSVSTPKSNDIKKTDTIAVAKLPPAKENSKGRLSYGLRFEAGRSAINELNFAKSASADMVSSPSAGGSRANAYSFKQEPSFAWSFGAWVRKPISQKVNIQTGLTFQHYRTRASQGDSNNYTNAYHLLSVPIEIGILLNKGKKLPVQWHFGIEPGWMVRSNATVQDTSGYLYSDKSMINRFQIGIQTGISFRLFQKSQYPLELGPIFKYMLTPTFKSGTGNDGHLNFLGIRADWRLLQIKSK